MKQYYLKYWLPNQSKIFSEPKLFVTESREALEQAISIANANGYEIEEVGELPHFINQKTQGRQ